MGRMEAHGASLEINITPKFSGDPIQPASLRYKTSAGEIFSITRISYLLSGFALQRADGSWLELTNDIAWLDMERGHSSHQVASLPSAEYHAIRFHLGLDEKQNHSDPAQHAADHPLNPNLNGLHWNWQGGYIFLALEGMWLNTVAASRQSAAITNGGSAALYRDAATVLDGWSYHFARDTNRTCITLAAQLNLTNDTRLELDFDLATLLNAPRPLSFGKNGSSTHSREGDPIAAALAANLPGSFHAHRISAGGASVLASQGEAEADGSRGRSPHQPLYLPEKFMPYRFQMSATFPIPDLPRDNPLTEERVALGEKLFHETALSKDNALSCASCHDSKHAFTDPRRYSVGVHEHVGTRNGMPLFNLAWRTSFFWDGRAPTLREQALMPIQDHTEMDETLTNVVVKLQSLSLAPGFSPVSPASNVNPTASAVSLDAKTVETVSPHAADITGLKPGANESSNADGAHGVTRPTNNSNYPALFTDAFGSPEITAEKIGLALESFVLTLTSFDSKFDRAIRGEETLSDDEKRGFELFMTEYDPRREQFGADCFHCHGGALFQSQTFANNGLELRAATFCRICNERLCDHRDVGRAKITGKDSDFGKFSTPSLRNIALTAPYMHDGRFVSLEEVVEHYSTGLKRSATLDPNLAKHPDGGIRLNKEDKAALVAFLKTLSDEKYLK